LIVKGKEISNTTGNRGKGSKKGRKEGRMEKGRMNRVVAR
jgi:hypothetical protein